MEQTLEAKLVETIDVANGAFVYVASSGLGNTAVSVRLYVDDATEPVVTDAVRTAFDVTWNDWDPKPVSITVEVKEGSKPAEPKRLDNKVIDITAAAHALGLPGADPYFKITLDPPFLTSVFGE